ncbi:PHF5-like protein [Hamiltosporidium tvaerminnensis]|uniref:PHF5-like protein n=1 Tax=Hamiltosporidium tvaerminnensis TaxID=1176355 RepID=A0A4V2JX69_9MICR|nr:PHF5-like protein [Hamiltosporidium tvaerminnensis]
MAFKKSESIKRCGGILSKNRAMICDKCSTMCCICKDFLSTSYKAYICENCASFSPSCVICGYSIADNTAYYCFQCKTLEKDRDGCPMKHNF